MIKYGVVREMLEKEFPGCDETEQCIQGYAENVPDGVDAGLHYDAYEQVVRTMIGMKIGRKI